MPSRPPTAAPPAVVLVRPREEGNIGAACRAMANMGLSELVLVEPVAEIAGLGRAMATHAEHVLDGARRAATLAEALGPYARRIGTTSARDRVGEQPRVTARELPALLAGDPPGTRTALVFGSEIGGLTTDELASCHPLVTIPSDPVQPTLNLAQAVLLVAYELFLDRLARGEANAAAAGEPGREPASGERTEALWQQGIALLRRVGFARDDSFEHAARDLRRLLTRAAPSDREVVLLRGVLRRTSGALDRAERGAGAAAGGSGAEGRR
ncbi:MAG TPA: TrmJ/YjtD family RNA methyltransferase [Thermoanaerobaculia bacterium]|nr:TrmJ/YjtD family RNA methyltransferase [Thermoanaerobaculia bacterium]